MICGLETLLREGMFLVLDPQFYVGQTEIMMQVPYD